MQSFVHFVHFIVFVQVSVAAGAEDDKAGGVAKMSDIRNRFEKFGTVTPQPKPVLRKTNLASSSFGGIPPVETSAGVGVDKAVADARILSRDLLKQLSDAEKTRVAERQELLEKMEKQRIDFENELQMYRSQVRSLNTCSLGYYDVQH